MRPLALALAGAALLLAAGAAAQTPPASAPVDKWPPAVRDRVTGMLSKLTADKLGAVMKANGLELPKDFLPCLCAHAPHTGGVGVRYADGQCVFSGFGVWGEPLPTDPKIWAACVAAHRLPDGRNLADAVADAAGSRRPPPVAATPAPAVASPSARLRALLAPLRRACLPLGAGPFNVADAYDREHADYLKRREEAQAIAADLPGKVRPRPQPPASQWLVDELEGAVAGAPDPCAQAAEAALVAEKANVRTLGDYAGALASTWYAPGGDDALDWVGRLKRVAGVWGLLDKGGAILDIAKEARAQGKHKAHAEAIEEARELIRASRGWTKQAYDGAVADYGAEADSHWKAIEQAAAALKERLADIARRRKQRPPGDALAQEQYDLSLDNEESHAKAVRAVTTREALARLDEIKFLKDTLDRFRKPLLGRTCEQWMAAACAEAAKQ